MKSRRVIITNKRFLLRHFHKLWIRKWSKINKSQLICLIRFLISASIWALKLKRNRSLWDSSIFCFIALNVLSTLVLKLSNSYLGNRFWRNFEKKLSQGRKIPFLKIDSGILTCFLVEDEALTTLFKGWIKACEITEFRKTRNFVGKMSWNMDQGVGTNRWGNNQNIS